MKKYIFNNLFQKIIIAEVLEKHLWTAKPNEIDHYDVP